MFSPVNNPKSNEWYWMDLPAVAAHLKAQPILVDALRQPANPGGYPVGGTTPVNLRNEHLQYAATWFTLSFISAMLLFKYAPTIFQKSAGQALSKAAGSSQGPRVGR